MIVKRNPPYEWVSLHDHELSAGKPEVPEGGGPEGGARKVAGRKSVRHLGDCAVILMCVSRALPWRLLF
jgi:hypothetical protein